MIYYFSGTGNSEWVAKEIARNLNDEAVNIIKINREESRRVKTGEVVGFVFPVYAWSAPEVMYEFIKKFTVEDGAFIFGVCTCDSEAGNTFKILDKQIKLNSSYSISMPTNYILMGDVQSEEVVNKKMQEAKESIKKICIEVSNRENVTRVKKGSLSLIKSSIIAKAFNKYARSTKSFKVEDSCISCGLCERLCPSNTIKLENGKPVWGEECMQCLSCINRCPKKSIQYGDKTKNKGRYYFKE